MQRQRRDAAVMVESWWYCWEDFFYYGFPRFSRRRKLRYGVGLYQGRMFFAVEFFTGAELTKRRHDEAC